MFMRWRQWVAAQVGIPLRIMVGFTDYIPEESDLEWIRNNYRLFPRSEMRTMVLNAMEGLHDVGGHIGWDCMRADPLCILLHHSDCDGRIHWEDAKAIAFRLLAIYRQTAGNDVRGHGTMDDRRGCYDSMRRATARFAVGLFKAWRERRDVTFG